jgi:hypothetical protein
MNKRITPDQLAEIRDEMKRRLADGGLSTLGWSERTIIALIDELDVVNQQADNLARELGRMTEYVKEMGDIP